MMKQLVDIEKFEKSQLDIFFSDYVEFAFLPFSGFLPFSLYTSIQRTRLCLEF